MPDRTFTQAFVEVLKVVGVTITPEQALAYTPEQRSEILIWASSLNMGQDAPPRPTCLPPVAG